jgi:hypothetical protein
MGCPAHAAAGWGCFAISMISTLLASYLDMAWMVVGQAAKGARDQELIRTVEQYDKETASQQQWLMTRLKAAAPQALLAAD